MKIFFFTTVFAPSIGGIERMAEMLCAEFVAMGHEVQLATLTPGNGRFPYPVIRRPKFTQFLSLLHWCDIHIQANVSLKYAWPLLVVPKKVVYRYANAYQRDDGSRSLIDFAKVALAARACGIANSHYTAARTGATHVVLNAYDDSTFRITTPWQERKRDLVFLGRLVSQKGCDTLLQALAHLRGQGLFPTLTVIGDGPDRPMLETMSAELNLDRQIHFTGTMQGQPLADLLNCHRFMVVPSRYEEPFGIVALEGLACGCVPIVSERGGLVDAISGHGFTFPNGDPIALAKVLTECLHRPEEAQQRLVGAESHLARCRARSVAEQYINIFRQKIGESSCSK
ncbi:glycosyltransferase family 4 protein [Thermostichus vulcanus]|uniref:Glycosyltransferase family 4 protein n=1 Tax=Thermostichus vulcanus str. 'Rupite' TaxID=2813851 RepID=A0ABT0CDZ5_THEVL|nr:glycosyltransferase family 4 protein [Thermostichus vulcanus str. 'Rupite']